MSILHTISFIGDIALSAFVLWYVWGLNKRITALETPRAADLADVIKDIEPTPGPLTKHVFDMFEWGEPKLIRTYEVLKDGKWKSSQFECRSLNETNEETLARVQAQYGAENVREIAN